MNQGFGAGGDIAVFAGCGKMERDLRWNVAAV